MSGFYQEKLLSEDWCKLQKRISGLIDSVIAASSLVDSRDISIPTVMVGGAARVGKSIFAERLSSISCGYCFRLDSIRSRAYLQIEDPDLRLTVKRGVLQTLLRKYPNNAVVEGDDLIQRNKGKMQNDPEIDLSIPLELRRRCGVGFVLLGCADATAKQKQKQIIEYRRAHNCWTADRKTDDEIFGLAKYIVAASVKLKCLSEVYKIPYYEIGCETFSEDLDGAVSHVVAQAMRIA